MSRLPTALQPAWPVVKRVHRLLSLLAGVCFRRLRPVLGQLAVPTTATVRSAETATREPEAVALHWVGPPEKLSRRVPPGDPPNHPAFTSAVVADIPERSVLDVRGGRLVGEFGATVTPNGVLDYQSSGYFGLSSWREHPLFLRPTLGRLTHVSGTVLSLTTRGAAGNYYHFLYDAIARYGIYEEVFGDQTVDAVVVPHQARYQRELLEMSGIRTRLIQPRGGYSIEADRLLVPSTPNQDLDAPHSAVSWLRRRLPPRPSSDSPRRLYLTRGRAPRSRRYVQEPDLLTGLHQRGFTVIDPGKLSVQDQIDVFHSAEVVVAPHGAGLTNLTFSRPGTKVLEMFAPTYVHLGLWAIAEAVGGIDYRYLVGDGPARPATRMTGVLDDVSIDPERVNAVIDDLLA